ncbi:MAG: DUF3108 domain-containing protein [Bacteroidetes bacterium]|nr:DUF3108 domain-containing protein [Bacteroidota bacterium]
MFHNKKILLFSFLIFLSFGFIIDSYQNDFIDNSAIQQFSNSTIIPADSLRTVKNESFKRGEKLKYRMHYGFINAGEVLMQVLDENKLIGGRNTLHIIGLGYTYSSFDWMFMVCDKYETYIDEQAMVPWLFIRRVQEGGYHLEQNQIFNHYKNTMDMDGKKFEVPDNVEDMISSFYFARTIDFSSAKEGDVFEFPCFVDDQVWPLRIKYIGKETIKSDIGKIRCIKFHPVVQQGRVFKKEEDLTAWISDDKNRIPIRAEAKIAVGSVKMDLMEYTGLANELALEKK